MSIDFEKFLHWAENRFDGNVKIGARGQEVRINSPFAEDYKYHCWCNVDPQIKDGSKRPFGTFHCFKTDERGSLITLVMLIDKCSFEDALRTLEAEDLYLQNAEKIIDEIMNGRIPVEEPEESEEPTGLELPSGTYFIDELPEDDVYRIQALNHLEKRNIPSKGLMVCKYGDRYKNRLIIPYYDRIGELIYFNARTLGDSTKVAKYLGPDKECGVGKSDVLYFPEWPNPGSRVYFSEGEIDSISIFLSRLDSGAFGGKNMGENQAAIIRREKYQPIVCLDNDSRGRAALLTIGPFLYGQGFRPYYVFPDLGHKDWNEMYVAKGGEYMANYIRANERVYDEINGIIGRII